MQQSRLDKELMPSAGSEKLAGTQKTFLACVSDIKSFSLWVEITLCTNTGVFFPDPSAENILKEAG